MTQMEEKLPQITPDEIQVEILSTAHNIREFTSYERELVSFLLEDALDNQTQKLSVTFLWLYEGKTVSYITILNDKINVKGELKTIFTQKGVPYGTLPALKIGRLCVDDHFLRRGLGKLMILTAIKIALEISSTRSGCRFITLDAKRNENKEKDPLIFYTKMGFKILQEKNKSHTPMYLDLQFIEEA